MLFKKSLQNPYTQIEFTILWTDLFLKFGLCLDFFRTKLEKSVEFYKIRTIFKKSSKNLSLSGNPYNLTTLNFVTSPRQNWVAIGCTKNGQPIRVTVHSDLRSDELLSYMQGMGCSVLKKNNF